MTLSFKHNQLVAKESVTGSGTKSILETTDAETILVSVFVTSIDPGATLKVIIKTYASEPSHCTTVIEFPLLNSASSELLLRKAAVTMPNLIVEITHTGPCSYEIYGRGIGTGDSSVKILSATSCRAGSKEIVTGSTQILVAAALTDRNGMVLKNNSTEGILYVGFSPSEATLLDGYPLYPGESLGLDIAAGVEVYAIAKDANVDVRFMEAA